MAKTLDVFGFGHICIDRLMVLKPYPAKGKKGDVVRSLVIGGGPVPTALKTAANFHLRAKFQGAVGDDAAGAQVIDELNRFGVETSSMVIDREMATAVSTVWVDPADGSRTIALDMTRSRLPKDEELDADAIRNCRLFLTDGRSAEASLRGLKIARASGAITMLDAGAVRPRFAEMLPLVDYCAVSRDLADTFSPGASPDELARLLVTAGVTAAIVTAGADGAVWRSDSGGGWVSGFRVEPVVDTTGAGDIFHGGLIYGLLNEWRIERAIRFANSAAALSCRELSGSRGIPSLKATLTLAGEL